MFATALSLPDSCPSIDDDVTDAPISASVGAGGSNRPGDVRAIQQMLNSVPVASGGPPLLLAEDGVCGPKTLAAIRGYQAKVRPSVDEKAGQGLDGRTGRIDPPVDAGAHLGLVAADRGQGLGPADAVFGQQQRRAPGGHGHRVQHLLDRAHVAWPVRAAGPHRGGDGRVGDVVVDRRTGVRQAQGGCEHWAPPTDATTNSHLTGRRIKGRRPGPRPTPRPPASSAPGRPCRCGHGPSA